MYAYESEKIVIGKDRTVSSLSWNSENSLIGVGFNDKSFKLLRLGESADLQIETKMSLNLTLPTNHKGAIRTMSWNENYDKLLTVDDKGMMIVWSENGADNYIEEMVNEAGSKLIKFAKWSSSGKYIIIVIEGGSLILGSVEGARIWGKDVEMEIEFVTFLERDKVILLGDQKGSLMALDTRSGEIFAEYDFHEEENKEVDKAQAKSLPPAKVNKVKVFEGTNIDDFGKILIGYQEGQVYLVHNLRENFLKKYNFNISQIQKGMWTKNGKFFSLSCIMENSPRILFINRVGEIMSCLTVKTTPIFMDFNVDGNQLVCATENNVTVVAIKSFRFSLYVSLENFCVVAFEKNRSQNVFSAGYRSSNEWQIVFMDLGEKLVYFRSASNLISLNTDGSRILIVSRPETDKIKYDYTIVDKKGVILYSLTLKFIPRNIEFKNFRVVITVGSYVVVWDLSEALSGKSTSKDTIEKPKVFWFSMKNTTVVNDCTHTNTSIFEGEKLYDESTKNLNIICLEISESSFYFCFEKGLVRRFSVNNFSEQESLTLNRTPKKIFINKNETCIAFLDQFSKLDISFIKTVIAVPINYECIASIQSANNFIFAANSTEFAYTITNNIFEKSISSQTPTSNVGDFLKDTKILKKDLNEEKQKPIQTESILIGFNTLEIVTLDTDFFQKMVQTESNPISTFFEAVKTIKTQKLRICDEFMKKIDNEIPQEFMDYMIGFKSSTVFDYCADTFLGEGRFELAQKLYTLSENFLALKFIEKLKNGVENDNVKRGEALMFLNKVKDAVNYLTKTSMSAFIPKLLISHGKIKGIDKFFHLIDVNAQNLILTHLGEHYKCTNEPKKAIKIFEKINDQENLMNLYFQTKKYDSLYSMLTNLKDKTLLNKYADLLFLSGNTDLAAKAYEKSGESKKAVDTAILGNCWSTAVEIAERQDFKQIDAIIHKFASLLSENKNKLDLVKLYRKAKKNAEAAKVLNSLANDLINCKMNPLVIKKVFVLAALEIYLYNKKSTDVNLTSNLTNITLSDMNSNLTKRALTTLITSDLNNLSEKILTNPWRGAEAWHYLIMCLKIFKQGNFQQALKVALRLSNFELELGEERVHSLIAILSFKCKFLKMFSKALSKLEMIFKFKGNKEMTARVQELAVKVFSSSDPKDFEFENCKILNCLNKNCDQKITEFDYFCSKCNSNFGICVLSGNNIYVKQYYKCNICNHKMLDAELEKAKIEFCPLCHSKIKKLPKAKIN